MRFCIIRIRFICGLFRIGSDLGQIDLGPYPTLSEPTPDPHLAVTCRMRFYTARFRLICGLFRIGCNFGGIGAGPYPTRSVPIWIPYLAVTCRMRLYWIRFRILCGLFRIGCDSDRIDVGQYPILSGPTPDPHLAVTCRMRFYTARFRIVSGLFRIGCNFGRIGAGPYPTLSDPTPDSPGAIVNDPGQIRMRALPDRTRFWPHRCWALSDPFGSDTGFIHGPYMSNPNVYDPVPHHMRIISDHVRSFRTRLRVCAQSSRAGLNACTTPTRTS
jgi:hypothetical protein